MCLYYSLSVGHQGHTRLCKYKSDTTICPRGYSCASIICGTRRYAKFFNVCEKEFEGIYPEAQLHIYTIGCGSCKPTMKHSINAAVEALDKAIKDRVKVILVCMDLPLQIVHNYKNLKDDKIGMKLLEVRRNGSLPIVPSGDEGPIEGSTQYGGPWCMAVGACTDEQILRTNIEIATTDENEEFTKIESLKVLLFDVNYFYMKRPHLYLITNITKFLFRVC